MSDYRFRCADCGKVTNTHSTGNVPELGDKVECISCGRILEVKHQNVILEVSKTKEKVSPSQLEKFALDKVSEKEKGGLTKEKCQV